MEACAVGFLVIDSPDVLHAQFFECMVSSCLKSIGFLKLLYGILMIMHLGGLSYLCCPHSLVV